MRTRSNAYYAVVWRLAQEISDFYHTYWVQTHISGESELRDAFRKGTP